MTSFHFSNDFMGFFRAMWVHTIILANKFFFNYKHFLNTKQNLSMKTIGVTAKEHFEFIYTNLF
ncbi:unnamed protein product [Nezara viridula]|uniref:Uncharacterized protein n=1 Tax=Nezara viridula TaxID=85310 RepID=A0A9P0GZK7_NEZVI|nr:unnamed protein product [Nezara viridula]